MKNRQEIEKILYRYIPNSTQKKYPAGLGLKRARLLLQILDNPQEKYRTIHIAGTSGKGTTAHILSHLLVAHGIRTGLHLSPHLQDIRERMIINNHLISEDLFISSLEHVLKAAQKCEKDLSRPTYFEILTALAFFMFAKKNVEVAVVETGMGGTYDATNTIKRSDKICVITKVGLDHTNILGSTISEIATQKAGIINKFNNVIAQDTKKATQVFKKRSEEKKASLSLITDNNFSNIRPHKRGVLFDYAFDKTSIQDLYVSLPGQHQAQNTTLALAALQQITGINKDVVKNILKKVRFKGRMDILEKNSKTYIVDGAHNPQKVKALTLALKDTFPDTKFTCIFAIKKGKDTTKILNFLKDITHTLITTSYFKDSQDLRHISQDASKVATQAKKLGFKQVLTTPSPQEALKLAAQHKNSHILITGSLYFLEDVYDELERTGHSQQGSL